MDLRPAARPDGDDVTVREGHRATPLSDTGCGRPHRDAVQEGAVEAALVHQVPSTRLGGQRIDGSVFEFFHSLTWQRTDSGNSDLVAREVLQSMGLVVICESESCFLDGGRSY